jgi:hypothetical protein
MGVAGMLWWVYQVNTGFELALVQVKRSYMRENRRGNGWGRERRRRREVLL